MRPIKSLRLMTGWLLRLGLLFLVGLLFWPELENFSFSSLNSVLNLVYGLSTVMLFFGGFSRRHTLTMISGLFLFLLSCWLIYWHFQSIDLRFGVHAIIGILAFYFFVNGNK